MSPLLRSSHGSPDPVLRNGLRASGGLMSRGLGLSVAKKRKFSELGFGVNGAVRSKDSPKGDLRKDEVSGSKKRKVLQVDFGAGDGLKSKDSRKYDQLNSDGGRYAPVSKKSLTSSDENQRENISSRAPLASSPALSPNSNDHRLLYSANRAISPSSIVAATCGTNLALSSAPFVIVSLDGEDAKEREGGEESEGRVLRPREPQRVVVSQPRFANVYIGKEHALKIVGRRIKVWWPLDECWYGGVVKDYSKVRNTHSIKYEDGVVERLYLEKERFLLEVLPGEVLCRRKEPDIERKTPTPVAVAINRERRKRKLQDDKTVAETQKTPTKSADGNPVTDGQISHAEKCAKDGGDCEPLGVGNDGSVCNVSTLRNASESIGNMNGNCSYGLQTSHKIVNVYQRRRPFHTNSKVHGINLSSVEQGIGLLDPESRALNSATTSHTFLSKSRGTISVPEVRCEDKSISHGLCNLASCRSIHTTSALDSNNGLPVDDKGGSTISVICKSVVVCPDDVSMHAAGEARNFVNAGKAALHAHSGEMSGKIPTVASQITRSQLSSQEMQCCQLPARSLFVGKFFLQKIHLDIDEFSKVALDFFREEVSFVLANLSKDALQRSFANQYRASSVPAKILSIQPASVQGFCGRGLASILLSWKQSSRFEDCIAMPEKGKNDEIPPRILDIYSELHDSGLNEGVDSVCFCDHGGWPFSFKSSRTFLFMEQKLSLDVAKGFFCNGNSSVAAFVKRNDCLQLEFSGRSDALPTVVEVVSGGSAYLADALESLQEAVKTSVTSFGGKFEGCSAPACRKVDDLYPLGVMGGHLGKSTVRRCEHFWEKKGHGKVTKAVVVNLTASEPSKLSLKEGMLLLNGENGFHLGLSQVVHIFMARNADFLLNTSYLLLRIHGDRGLVKIRPTSEYFLRTEEMSCISNVQLLHKKVRYMRRRKREKVLKDSCCSLNGDLAQEDTQSNGLADCQERKKCQKRRKMGSEKLNGKILTANVVPRKSHNNVEELLHGPSECDLGEKVYPFSSKTWQNGSKLSHLSSTLEVSTPCRSNAQPRSKSVESKQSNSSLEFGSSKMTLYPVLSTANSEREQVAAEFPTSFDFQQNNIGAKTSFSDCHIKTLKTLSNRNGINKENLMNVCIRGKRHYNLGFEGAVDKFLQDQRNPHKGITRLVENEQGAGVKLFSSEAVLPSFPGCDRDNGMDKMRYQEPETQFLSCMANILFLQNDKGWRELGARVELLLVDHTWFLSIREHSLTHKAEQPVPSGSINRYTHAMMWKGGKDWSLEFEDKRQWLLFKEMHQECFQRNAKVALVRNIPIPGVYLVQESLTRSSDHLFVRPEHSYIFQSQGEKEAALNCSRALYDIDSEDEEWLAQTEKNFNMLGIESRKISYDMFEAIIEKLEKAAYINHHNMLAVPIALEICQGLGPPDVIEAVHSYWAGKRHIKGMSLVRYFQPAPWERYECQLQDWEAGVESAQYDATVSHNPVPSLAKKPPWFAFCLRPKGLDVPNKVQKQRSQRKLGSAVSAPKNWSFPSLSNRATDDIVGSQVDRGPSNEYAEELYHAALKKSDFELGEDRDTDAGVLGRKHSLITKGGKVCPGNVTSSFDKPPTNDADIKILRRTPSCGKRRWKAKKLGKKSKRREAFATARFCKGRGKSRGQVRMLQTVHSFKGKKAINAGLPEVTGVSSSSSSMRHDTSLLNSKNGEIVALSFGLNDIIIPDLDLDLEAAAVAKATVARKAAHVARHKRAKAQALYAIADAAMRKAVSAMMAAEAIEAQRACMASISQGKQSDLGSHSKKRLLSNADFVSKKSSDPIDEDFIADCFVPRQEITRKTVKSTIKMLSREESTKEEFLIGDDALLPIAGWSRELGAGIGTRLIHTGEMSPQKGLRHPSALTTVSECAS